MTTQFEPALPQMNAASAPSETAALKDAVRQEASRLCAERMGRSLRTVVMTGSMARNEATFVEDGGQWKLLGDVDLLLIFPQRAQVPDRAAVDSLRNEIEVSLLRRGLMAHVTIGAAGASYLRKMKPHIFGYELRACGEVVWGEQDILSLIPAFSASEIPLEDAWRLLCNRMIEQLEVVDGLANDSAIPPLQVLYPTVKLFLDMTTSLLLFAGEYQPTYAARAQKLAALAVTESSEKEYPFTLGDFSQRVAWCTQWKLCAAQWDSRSGREFWEEAVRYAYLLWRWELKRLSRTRAELSDSALARRWMQHQPLPRRLRGWLYVLRSSGWLASWRHWPRWARLGWRASPRYWVYAAASELFFQLPSLLFAAGRTPVGNKDWGKLRSWLPVARESDRADERPSWQRMAGEVAWNYHQFLEGTRA